MNNTGLVAGLFHAHFLRPGRFSLYLMKRLRLRLAMLTMEYPSGPRLRFSWLIFTFSELAICPQKEAAIHKKVFLNFDNYCLSAVLKNQQNLQDTKQKNVGASLGVVTTTRNSNIAVRSVLDHKIQNENNTYRYRTCCDK
jgi:hypothetical protein